MSIEINYAVIRQPMTIYNQNIFQQYIKWKSTKLIQFDWKHKYWLDKRSKAKKFYTIWQNYMGEEKQSNKITNWWRMTELSSKHKIQINIRFVYTFVKEST